MDEISFWLVVVTLLLFVCYAFLIEYYRKGWRRLPVYTRPEDFKPYEKVTVIIPARDEEKNIGTCLQSLVNQDYPAELLQVIVVDDHSTDRTPDIVTGFNNDTILLVSLKDHVDAAINSYKKKAIEVAMEKATGNWIITTDADCISGHGWISSRRFIHCGARAAAAGQRAAEYFSIAGLYYTPGNYRRIRKQGLPFHVQWR
jgi:cellulose synthase/poly-beta-1,6-N-acetylglucosamine synthase-like glycosyltransferase